MVRLIPASALAIALVFITGCSSEPARTEIIVAVDTDLSVPDELDGVRIDMVGPGGQVRRTMGPVPTVESLPATVGMIHGIGPLGPVQVTVVGVAGGRDIIQRRATVSFVEGRTLVLWVHLPRECLDVRCTPTETCAPGGCRAIDVDATELVDWTGSIDRLDASTQADSSTDGGMDAGDACAPKTEECNGRDDDCDGDTDEDFDTMTDIANCGACGNGCPVSPPNAASECSAGTCALACDPGFADCDGDASTGCEALLSTPSTCGACAIACTAASPLCQGDAASDYSCVSSCAAGFTECGSLCTDVQTDAQNCGDCEDVCAVGSHAAATCEAGSCAMACDPDFGDCDGVPDTGCEASLTDVAHCGACGVVCEIPSAIESCATGACTLARCEVGFGDCDADAATGCETDVTSSITDCGTCGTVCSAAPRSAPLCEMGACALVCDPGFGDCDGNPMNGCESLLSGAATCGSCGISCLDPTPICEGSPAPGFTCAASCAAPSVICGTVCTSTEADAQNCGACEMVCPAAAQASPMCAGDACGIACDPGFGDCNASAADGCEVTLTTTSDCGACGATCAPTHGTGVCFAGACTLGSCDADWLNCDGDPANGCETRSSMDNCEACDDVCPTSAANTESLSCTAGTCSLVCSNRYGNCNHLPLDGCEVELRTVTNCGACGNSCVLLHATATRCIGNGTCKIDSCDSGFADCDGSVTNGCETDVGSGSCP
ncbi:MAG: hypothetical protein JRH11_01125 [Deltaproteobacteria bacterium]|nr:hypothetical protein [Deltaproteobacteria bacterium]